MSWFSELLDNATPVKREKIVAGSRTYWVNYMSAEVMERAHSFGCAHKGEVYVRSDLLPKVKRFVISHEMYHLQDRRVWLGWLGGELRANFVPGMKDPVGLLLTIKASLTRERLGAYWRALTKVGIRRNTNRTYPLG
jgi:hypothetical protein